MSVLSVTEILSPPAAAKLTEPKMCAVDTCNFNLRYDIQLIDCFCLRHYHFYAKNINNVFVVENLIAEEPQISTLTKLAQAQRA